MKRQTVTQIVSLSLLGLFLLTVVGCGGGATTSLSREEFEKKVTNMSPEKVVEWLGKPTSVTDDTGSVARWHYRNVCVDKLTGKTCNVELTMYLKPNSMGDTPKVFTCDFSAD